jgi:predicted Zn-dependent protease
MTGRSGIRGMRAGMGRVGGVVLGLAALAGAGAAGWTLLRLAATEPAPETGGPVGEAGGPGMASQQTVEAVLATVQRLIGEEQHGAAENVLSDAVRQFPADQDLRLAYGDLLMSRSRWDEAYAQFLGAAEIGPVPAPVEFTAGILTSQSGKPEMAAAHFANAMRLDPNEPNYPMYLASAQLKLNQTQEAKASLAMAARLAPDRAQIYGMLAQIALNENKPEIARQHIARARSLQPAEPVWVLMEARVLKRAGDAEAAVEVLHTLPQRDLDQPETLKLLSECYGLLGRPAEAASRYVDAAERSPDDVTLAFEAALWLERAGETVEAVRWARRADRGGHEQAGRWLAARAGSADAGADAP